MIDATISGVRLRDLARRGRFRNRQSRFAAPPSACAPERPPRAPEEPNLVASTIQ
jgi:hypothetical protein